ncbi:glyoxalase superfamily protein [Polycladidibacter hongkongensis]|uniref:glyoxalase superfamily protein n=1 Tax=Polycladidibacter hongkongensis TaxID=1647556 RepID=UPI00082EE744|nr:glyoxalase superfamily protein [Pseudovibrio hongkongensis]
MTRTRKNQAPKLQELKNNAKSLRAALAEKDQLISHSQSLEITARQHGYKDWNSAAAGTVQKQKSQALQLGRSVAGTYLNQEFKGQLLAVRTLQGGQYMQITVQLEKPVDVVSFDSFSNYRSRITCTLDKSGRSLDTTSDGTPHMQLGHSR